MKLWAALLFGCCAFSGAGASANTDCGSFTPEPANLVTSVDGTVESVLNAKPAALLRSAGVEGRLAVGAILSENGTTFLATAALVSETHILTTAHSFASVAALHNLRFLLGYSVAERGGVVSGGQDYHCLRLNAADVVGSHRGHRDYLLVALAAPVPKNNAGRPFFNPLPVSAALRFARIPSEVHLLGMFDDRYEGWNRDQLKAEAARWAEAGAHVNSEYTLSYVSGLALLSKGRLGRVGRYTKDAGTSIGLDYFITTQKKHSGSPVLTSDGKWVAMHQRNLNDSKCETQTPWHPYVSHYYYDAFGGTDVKARMIAECREGIPPSNALPRQGIPLNEIATDVYDKVGFDWMCKSVPQLLALHDVIAGGRSACTAVSYLDALVRMQAEVRANSVNGSWSGSRP